LERFTLLLMLIYQGGIRFIRAGLRNDGKGPGERLEKIRLDRRCRFRALPINNCRTAHIATVDLDKFDSLFSWLESVHKPALALESTRVSIPTIYNHNKTKKIHAAGGTADTQTRTEMMTTLPPNGFKS
jgi:hypothetical protein